MKAVMERKEQQVNNFDGGFNTLICQDSLQCEDDQPYHQSNQSRLQELIFYVGLGRRNKLATVSLVILASVLLIVNIALSVHYNKATNTHPMLDDIALSKELAKLQDAYKATVNDMTAVQKQVDSEMSRQTETRWEYEHQTKRTKDYEVQMEKLTNDVAKLRSYLPMITDGCRHCPPGWLLINSVCYYFSFSNYFGLKTWQKARDFCQLHGGDLLVIDTKDKENATVKLLINHQNPTTSNVGFWFGLRDSLEEGTWKWLNGSFLVEGYWKDGEPSNSHNNEDCAEVYPEKNFFKAWNDARCNTQRKWICEKASTPMR